MNRIAPLSEKTAKPIEPMSHPEDDMQAVEKLGETRDAIVNELHKTIKGMEDVIDEMMIAIFARGHCLLVGVPGLAKTLLVSSLAKTMSLGFKRIQFTPDLMPSDITGTELLQEDPETHRRSFKFQKGPVFTNLLLADEIHRMPLKTQAAQLEAMLDKRVSSEGEDYHHDAPFFVLKTQNPIKREGTNPLPEAQIDRFLIHILIKYPCAAEELEIIRSVNTDEEQITNQIVDGPTFLKFQHLVRRITVCAGNRRSRITQNLLQHILAKHANDSSIAPVIPLLLDRHHHCCLHQVPLSAGGMGL